MDQQPTLSTGLFAADQKVNLLVFDLGALILVL
jgi:hypothetical protein